MDLEATRGDQQASAGPPALRAVHVRLSTTVLVATAPPATLPRLAVTTVLGGPPVASTADPPATDHAPAVRIGALARVETPAGHRPRMAGQHGARLREVTTNGATRRGTPQNGVGAGAGRGQRGHAPRTPDDRGLRRF